MNDIKITASIEQIKHLGDLFNGIQGLINQIEIAEFKDENGHELKCNDVYQEVKMAIRELTKEKEPTPNITVSMSETSEKADVRKIIETLNQIVNRMKTL